MVSEQGKSEEKISVLAQGFLQETEESQQGLSREEGVQIPGFVADQASEGASTDDPGHGVAVPSSLRGSVNICSSDRYFFMDYVEVVSKRISLNINFVKVCFYKVKVTFVF